MALFPLFIDLKEKECVVIGGGKIADRKIETLIKFAAKITVVSPEISESIALKIIKGQLFYNKRNYQKTDIEYAFLVIAATSEKSLNEKIYQDATDLGVFVNVVDNPEKCTFLFPSVIQRDDLVIGISTSGSYPALSKSIRKKIETLILNDLPDGLTGILRKCRERAFAEISDEAERKELLERIIDEAVFCKNATGLAELNDKIDKIFNRKDFREKS